MGLDFLIMISQHEFPLFNLLGFWGFGVLGFWGKIVSAYQDIEKMQF